MRVKKRDRGGGGRDEVIEQIKRNKERKTEKGEDVENGREMKEP